MDKKKEVNTMWVIKGLLRTPVRLFKKDPVTFLCSTCGAIAGTISLILHFVQ